MMAFVPSFLCSQNAVPTFIPCHPTFPLIDPGLPAVTAACLGRCQEAGFKEEMAANVLLCGGCTMLEGFPQRFQRELSLLCPGDSLSVAAAPERKTSVWTGGSILASLQAFQQLWVSKEEFRERGSAAIYSKC